MYDINYSLTESLEKYQQLILDYPLFLYIFLAVTVFGFLLWMNRKSRITFYFTLGALLLLIIMSFYFRGLELFEYIDTVFRGNFYKNLYFYYWNMFFCFLFLHIQISSKKITEFSRILAIIFYVLLATNVIFQFYISSVVGGGRILVLGNTAPMIIIGNITSFLLYLYFAIFKIVCHFQKK